MGRQPDGNYLVPDGTYGAPDQTVYSARYNGWVNDVAATFNAVLPINKGGTGADNAEVARENLSAEMAGQAVVNYDSHIWENGSFNSAAGATGAPNAIHAFAGICYKWTSDEAIVLEARDLNDTTVPGRLYIRERKASIWGPWTVDADDKVDVAGDVMTGPLTATKFILSSGAEFSTTALHGLYADGSNIAIRPPSTSSFYVQGSDGTVTYAVIGPGTTTIYSTSGVLAPAYVVGDGFGVFKAGAGLNERYFAFNANSFLSYNPSSTTANWTHNGSQWLSLSSLSEITLATPVTCSWGRIISRASSDPSIGCHNTSTTYNFGIWSAADATLNFGLLDANGVPTTQYMKVNGASNLTVNGNGLKPGGGVWADSSDARIKNVLGDYQNGLDAIKTLRPVTYTFKGNDTPAGVTGVPPAKLGEDGVKLPDPKELAVVPYGNSPHYNAANKEFVGLIAQECEAAFPEMVTQHDAMIDGQPVTDMRVLDTTPLIFALVNAVKTLAARIEALEASLQPQQQR